MDIEVKVSVAQKDQKVQDAYEHNWVDRYAPPSARPFLRLSRFDRPVGSWLLFLPCFFGACFAGIYGRAAFWDVMHFVVVCLVGAWLMRGAGCTWNDIVDRKIDAEVERTRSRPIPSGSVHVYGAAIWMCIQAVLALMALVTLETRTIWTAIGALVIVAIYPYAKRVTNWPQIVLGLAFNWGVILAYVELSGGVSAGMFALYFGLVFWTLHYDTIYAFQDIADDKRIGVRSTARALEDAPAFYLAVFSMLSISLIVLAIALDISPLKVVIIMSAGAFVFLLGLLQQVRRFDQRLPEFCRLQFIENVRIGRLVGVIWFLGYLALIVT